MKIEIEGTGDAVIRDWARRGSKLCGSNDLSALGLVDIWVEFASGGRRAGAFLGANLFPDLPGRRVSVQ